MELKLYTVEDISKMLNMHPKTIGRYIREGKLVATKIGKTWRVTGDALSKFTEGNISENQATKVFNNENSERINPKISVSAVIDIDCINEEEVTMLTNTLIAIGNSKGSEYKNSSISVQYIMADTKLRAMLWGSASFVETTLSLLSNITNNHNEQA